MNTNNYQNERWSKEEDDILRNTYSSCDQKQIMSLLPKRTWGAIHTRAIKSLGLSRNLVGWTKEEDKILQEKYARHPKDILLNSLPRRTWQGIQSRAIRVLGLSRNSKEWSKEEIAILSNYYPSGGVKAVKSFLPLRSNSAIVSMASILKISMLRGDCDVSPLLTFSPIACYWIGFLLADAHFNLKNKRCTLTLAKKDKEVIKKFASFVSCSNIRIAPHNSVSVSIYSKDLIPKLCDRFSIKSDKTRNPPDLSAIKDNTNLMLAMLIGLIDGDGYIFRSKDCHASYMKLMCHMSWTVIYRQFCSFLINNFNNEGESPHCYIGHLNKNINGCKRKYLNFAIYDHHLLKILKRKAIQMNLPFMKRKWNDVDLEYVTERELTPRIMITIRKMIERGLNKREIMRRTGYTCSRVGWSMKKIALEKI